MNNTIIQIKKNKAFIQYFSWRSSQILVKGVSSLVILGISVSYLTSTQYGIITYYTSLLTLFLIFCDFGISASASRFTAEYNEIKSENERKIFGSSTFLIFIFASVTSIVIIFFGKKYLAEYYPQVLFLIPCLFLAPISALLDGIYRGNKKFKELFFRNFYASILTIIVSFYLIMTFKVKGALIALVIANLFYSVAMIFDAKIIIGEYSLSVMKDVSKYALYIGFANISYFMYTQVDILILEKFGFIKEIGYYGIIDRIFNFFLLPPIILGQVIAPEISRLSVTKNDKTINRLFKLTSVFGIPIAIIITIIIYITGITILTHWGDQYNTKSFITIFNLLAILLPLKLWSSFTVNGFITPSGNVYIITILTFIGGISNIILDLLLIKLYGFVGIFIATIVVHSLCIFFVNIFFYKKIKREEICL
jgi:O-antigen/teichoic acid export membrane protein